MKFRYLDLREVAAVVKLEKLNLNYWFYAIQAEGVSEEDAKSAKQEVEELLKDVE